MIKKNFNSTHSKNKVVELVDYAFASFIACWHISNGNYIDAIANSMGTKNNVFPCQNVKITAVNPLAGQTRVFGKIELKLSSLPGTSPDPVQNRALNRAQCVPNMPPKNIIGFD